ncbi:restriction endonuclease [Corynebacterium lizhenjunii]|uniref:Restriction endonuclease n=1 Tax=Corynebacterium lizhenjunii TaxID=2709394 RepID=A0A7T0KG40_9CORY|nr:restriction endonuclease [Corynebacterium lizhenjunii]QPK79098.1 restriction endonuclease [Corynebacterium lizhenjunii]
MATLKWDGYLIPVLEVLASDGAVWKRSLLIEATASRVGISEEERAEVIPSGQTVYANRIGWALSYLKKAGAVTSPSRAHFQIMELGRDLIVRYPSGMTEKDLRIEAVGTDQGGTTWQALGKAEGRGGIGKLSSQPEEETDLDPIEQVETGVARNDAFVAEELLTRLHENEPEFFEQAVLDLLMAMGYGGTQGKATRTQLSNDGGIDGIIDQDALGLSRIYVQAKRYGLDRSIGRPDIQGFVGALQGAQADRGVFLTTGKFSEGAKQYAEAVASRVVLIDGVRLAQLMIRYGVGVQVKRTVAIVEVDEDYFE